MRDGKIGEGFESKPNGVLETTPDPLKYLWSCFAQMERRMHDGICCKRSETGEKEHVWSCVSELAACLLFRFSSSSSYKVENIIWVLCREQFDPRMFADHLSSMADCHKVTDLVWERCLLKANFERYLINLDKDVLYKKKTIEVLCKQLKFANVK